MKDLNSIRELLETREQDSLSPLATLSKNGVRRKPEPQDETGYRQAFTQDVDRILHSLAYTRYIDKTQVFSLIQNDHLTHRVLHVQLVSKVARTIGRFLSLNEDLIEAIALGHDIGHTPFGHDGERMLSKLCVESGIGYFHHNIQSIQFLDKVERKGKGWNLCLQTIDGIFSHDGEVHNQKLAPSHDKTFDVLFSEMDEKKKNPNKSVVPMTLEGCVVRMADTISYIGRDFEDAIRIGMVTRSEIPKRAKTILGDTNGTIVFSLVTDIIKNSYQKPTISFSPDVSEALQVMKNFNLERIYMNVAMKQHLKNITQLFEVLFKKFLKDIKKADHASAIFTQFLKDMSDEYLQHHCDEEIVRDFLAGMTDHYFIRQCPEKLRPTAVVMD
jgi:dGTPase